MIEILMLENNKLRSDIDIKIVNTTLQHIKQFCYLGSNVMKDNCCTVEIKE